MPGEKHHKIDFVEFTTTDMNQTKTFYRNVFGWEFQDYGPEYADIKNAGITGGFWLKPNYHPVQGVLIVIYSNDLEKTQASIKEAGGKIIKEIFSFPGGRRFHFVDPTGNELAVWTDK